MGEADVAGPADPLGRVKTFDVETALEGGDYRREPVVVVLVDDENAERACPRLLDDAGEVALEL
jgi:hypothetical protein